ncbi:PRC-barrel domain protein [Methanobrevibacter cuticularis]|uniref:PRC-barrel domain protein n=1 Tax=Methanobrevibacter cuticularis TaxID=47311 RepID=A0A166EQU0_9EURY|nr:PRC-barrel domain-containing protein [Methanobrevibacter cuticularis]KZX16910.1 PRC-barrel domain protein [Methanobrevibacter cuticularis]
MKADKLLSMKVIDKNGNDVGKVGNIELNMDNFSIEGVEVIESTGILSHNTELIKAERIQSISDNIVLNE